jgi:hypothetical protein
MGHEDQFPPAGESGRCRSRERSEIYMLQTTWPAWGLRAGDLPLLNAFKGAILASKPAGAS